jgi:hypothetical protein
MTQGNRIPTTILEHLNKVFLEDTKDGGKAYWDIKYTSCFWLIKDDDELIDFLRFGLGAAIDNLLSENEKAWRSTLPNAQHETDEESVNRKTREKTELAKYPKIYSVTNTIFEFFAAFQFHRMSIVGSWSETGMIDVIDSFRFLGLSQIADAYAKGIKNSPKYKEGEDLMSYSRSCDKHITKAFETVIEFNITQQHLDVTQRIRENYHLFLVP